MSKVWFITGASRGIGAEIAKAALADGHKVLATGRNPDVVSNSLGTSDKLSVTALDVTRKEQILRAVQAALERFGCIDVLVNNAGYGQLGVFEETTLEEIRSEYETNVFGLMVVTHAIIPWMRQQRSGRIFNISSVAGLKGGAFNSIYSSSKFAVEGFSQSIAAELAPFGIHVTSVSPGYFRTDFLDQSSVKYSRHSISDYDAALGEFRSFHETRNHNQGGDPAKLARVILQLSKIQNPPVSFVAGSDAVEWAESGIRQLQGQIDEWRDLSDSTDGDGGEYSRMRPDRGSLGARPVAA